MANHAEGVTGRLNRYDRLRILDRQFVSARAGEYSKSIEAFNHRKVLAADYADKHGSEKQKKF